MASKIPIRKITSFLNVRTGFLLNREPGFPQRRRNAQELSSASVEMFPSIPISKNGYSSNFYNKRSPLYIHPAYILNIKGLGLHFVRYRSATAFVNKILLIHSVMGSDLIGQEYCKLFIFPTQNVFFFSFSLISRHGGS